MDFLNPEMPELPLPEQQISSNFQFNVPSSHVDTEGVSVLNPV